MFTELDKLMHERPVNQMALAAWAMCMHNIFKYRLPQLEENVAAGSGTPWGKEFYLTMTEDRY